MNRYFKSQTVKKIQKMFNVEIIAKIFVVIFVNLKR